MIPFLDLAAVEPGDVVVRDGDGWRWFRAPVRVVSVTTVDSVAPALREVEAWCESGWAAGFVSFAASRAFEPAAPDLDPAGLPLLRFSLFEQPGEPYAALPPALAPDGATGPGWTPSLTETDYEVAFDAIHQAIGEGEVYQVNLTLPLEAPPLDPAAWFASRMADGAPPYAAYLPLGDATLASASPELFFDLADGRLVSRPMKGTRTAAGSPAELRTNAKDRAENLMIVDMVRNDLGRVAVPGTVRVPRLFEVRRHGPVLQMTTDVTAETDAGLSDIFHALFPPASVVGAPKVAALHQIAHQERWSRGVYCGAIGVAGPKKQARFSVAIRTAVFESSAGRYGVGSGVVWDSTADGEWSESLVKSPARFAELPPFELLETMRGSARHGVPLLALHLDRLATSAVQLGWTFDRERAESRVDAALAGHEEDVRLRLLLNGEGAFRVEVHPILPVTDLRAHVADSPVFSGDPLLRLKSTWRARWDSRLRDGWDEVLLFNELGEATEFRYGNLVVEVDGRLFTPPVACGCLPGVGVAHLRALGKVEERVFTVPEVLAAPRVYRANAVTPLVPVRF